MDSKQGQNYKSLKMFSWLCDFRRLWISMWLNREHLQRWMRKQRYQNESRQCQFWLTAWGFLKRAIGMTARLDMNKPEFTIEKETYLVPTASAQAGNTRKIPSGSDILALLSVDDQYTKMNKNQGSTWTRTLYNIHVFENSLHMDLTLWISSMGDRCRTAKSTVISQKHWKTNSSGTEFCCTSRQRLIKDPVLRSTDTEINKGLENVCKIRHVLSCSADQNVDSTP